MPRTTNRDLYDRLPSEQVVAGRALDLLSERELAARIHAQDRRGLAAVARARDAIAGVAAAAAAALAAGGRLLYLGAGTSGRLATLDAAECPPTFGVSPSRVVALMAGGRRALTRAVEGAEDSRGDGRRAVARARVTARDLVCGVSASGVTPFVRAGLEEARRRSARTALVTCAPPALVAAAAELVVSLEVGGEALAGSTRMASGLATKAALHTISTSAMVRLGHVYGQLMIEVTPTSRKLRRRATRIVAALTGLDEPRARALLARAGSPKLAAVMHHRAVDRAEAGRLLAAASGRLRAVIGDRGAR
jgi:N-acetylmuramic acid 6-phosphate etherase